MCFSEKYIRYASSTISDGEEVCAKCRSPRFPAFLQLHIPQTTQSSTDERNRSNATDPARVAHASQNDSSNLQFCQHL